MGELKLFVVGESSGDPDKWSEWNPFRAIVIARDEKEARKLADSGREVAEIAFTKPVQLMCETMPDGL